MVLIADFHFAVFPCRAQRIQTGIVVKLKDAAFFRKVGVVEVVIEELKSRTALLEPLIGLQSGVADT